MSKADRYKAKQPEIASRIQLLRQFVAAGTASAEDNAELFDLMLNFPTSVPIKKERYDILRDLSPIGEERSSKTLSYIYFIELEEDYPTKSKGWDRRFITVPKGAIKIGYTVDLRQRLREHSKNFPRFKVLGAIKWEHSPLSGAAKRGDGQEAEDLIHWHFDRCRIDKGAAKLKSLEFFWPEVRLLKFISKNTVPLENLLNVDTHQLSWTVIDGQKAAQLPLSLFRYSKREADRAVFHRFWANGSQMYKTGYLKPPPKIPKRR